MASVNVLATHKYVIVLNEKSSIGKLLSATGQLAMSLFSNATEEQIAHMNLVPLPNPSGVNLIDLSTCSFVVLKGNAAQILTLFAKARESGVLSAVFTSTMSFNGVEEDLFLKTVNTPLDQAEPYGVALFGKIEELHPLTKKFSVFK